MDKSIRELYMIVLNKRAKIVRCIEYKQHYEIHLEWETEKPYGMNFGDDAIPWDWVEKKVISITK